MYLGLLADLSLGCKISITPILNSQFYRGLLKVGRQMSHGLLLDQAAKLWRCSPTVDHIAVVKYLIPCCLKRLNLDVF